MYDFVRRGFLDRIQFHYVISKSKLKVIWIKYRSRGTLERISGGGMEDHFLVCILKARRFLDSCLPLKTVCVMPALFVFSTRPWDTRNLIYALVYDLNCLLNSRHICNSCVSSVPLFLDRRQAFWDWVIFVACSSSVRVEKNVSSFPRASGYP